MTNPFFTATAALAFVLAGAMAVPAQNAVTFGTLKADPNAPVEVTADKLAVDQGMLDPNGLGVERTGRDVMNRVGEMARITIRNECGDLSYYVLEIRIHLVKCSL